MKIMLLLASVFLAWPLFAVSPVIRVAAAEKADAAVIDQRKSLIFNGIDTKLEFPKPQEWKDFTVAFWMYPESFPGTVFCKPGHHLLIRIGKDGVAQAQAWSADKKFLGGRAFGKVRKKSWSHLAMTYDSKAAKLLLYHNGLKVSGFDIPASGLFDSRSGLIFGTDAKNKTFFKGAMDCIQVWTYALPSEEITALYEREDPDFGKVAVRLDADHVQNVPVRKEKLLSGTNVIRLKEGDNNITFSDPAFREGGSHTFAIWVKPQANPKHIYTLMLKRGHNSSLFLRQDGRFCFEYWLEKPGGFSRLLSDPYPPEQWYCVVGMMDTRSKCASLYINGTLAARSHFAGSPRKISQDFFVGGQSEKDRFVGLLNDARVYHCALKNADIRKMFQEGRNRYGAVPAVTMAKVIPAYAPHAVSPQQLAEYKRNIPAELEKYETKLQEHRRNALQLFGPGASIQKERVEKRLEIAESLCRYIRRNLTNGTEEGLLFASLGIADLKNYPPYFELEEAFWKEYPTENGRNPAGKVSRKFNVKDFGAKGDGVSNDSPAFKAAFEAIAKLDGNPAILRIPAGKYLLADPMEFQPYFHRERNAMIDDGSYRRAHLAINDFRNLIIEGDGIEQTHLLLGIYDITGVRINYSRNVTFRNLQLYHKEPPFCQGKILSIDQKNQTIVIQHESRTMRPTDPRKPKGRGSRTFTAYGKDGCLVKTGHSIFSYADNLDNGRYRMHFEKGHFPRRLEPGMNCVVVFRENLYHGVSFGDCTLCNAENIMLRTSRSAGFSTRGEPYSTTFAGCILKPLDGLNLATDADGLFCGKGTCMLRCMFSNTCDDGINSLSSGRFAAKAEGKRIIHWRRFPAGETLIFVHPHTGQIMAQNVTAKASIPVKWGNRNDLFETELLYPLPAGLPTWNSLEKSTGYPSKNGAFTKEPLPVQIYAPAGKNVATVVSGNQFRNIRSSGIVVQASNTLVENNLIDHSSWMGLRIGCLLNYGEGPAPYNITVRNNHFIAPGDALVTHYQTASGGNSPCALFHGLTIENNTVEDANFSLRIENASDTVVRNNKLTSGMPATILFRNSKDIRTEGNTFNGKTFSQVDIMDPGSILQEKSL